jgi:nucleoside-diphosphate-sugar epimerase
MLKVAILGASGFVGSRLVEMFHLGELADIRPVVRSYSSAARLSRFKLDWQIADARDQAALTKAFHGCDMIIHCVSGDAPIIVNSVKPAYQAAQAAGVKRMIYLSSAVVHGQAPAVGTDETGALKRRQVIPYNNAKVIAEQSLLRLRRKGKVEVVILRPGVVYGPRSTRWITAIADDILRGSAYLINDGLGICNSIYVDNLVHAIYLSLLADGKAVDQQAFLVGDQETVTWLEFYTQLAQALGVDPITISRLDMPEFKRTWRDYVQDFRAATPVQAILPYIPEGFKSIARAKLLSLGHRVAYPSSFADSSDIVDANLIKDQPVVPTVSQEMSLLHLSTYKLPHSKAEKLLSYKPVYSFNQGMQKSIAWLSFAGYPISETANS